jgi:hypothetical protein
MTRMTPELPMKNAAEYERLSSFRSQLNEVPNCGSAARAR